MPLARAAMYAQGENLHVAIWPGNLRNTVDITRFMAREGRGLICLPRTDARARPRPPASARAAQGGMTDPTPRPLERFAVSVDAVTGMVKVDKTVKCQVELGTCDAGQFFIQVPVA